MWIKEIFLAFCGLVFGSAVAAGTFAFILIIGVVPRLIGKCHRAAGTMLFETIIILGTTTGCVWSTFPQMPIPFGTFMLMIFGLSAGIFVGCIALALAEILDAYPILFRRIKVKQGLNLMIFAVALGKMIGSFYFFLFMQ